MKITSSSKKSALKLFAFCVIFSMLFMNSAPAIYANASEEAVTEQVTPAESVVVEDEIVPETPLSDLAQEEPEEVTEPEVVVDEVISEADKATSEVKVVEKELSVVAKDKAIVKTEKETKVIDIAKEVETWTKLGNASYETTESVKLGKTYVYPENSKVQITFTKLPENTKKVTIKELNADGFASLENQVANNKVYEITSAMANGTFEYKLNLPDAGIVSPEIMFSENGNDFTKATTHDLGDKVKTTLNHFTYFAVVGGEDTTSGSAYALNPDEITLLQTADDTKLYWVWDSLFSGHWGGHDGSVQSQFRWPQDDYESDKYIEFNISPDVPDGAEIVNATLEFRYARSFMSVSDWWLNHYGAKIVLNNGSEFDVWNNSPKDFVTHNIDLTSSISSVSDLESFKFMIFGNAPLFDQGMYSYHDFVRLNVEWIPAAPTITTPAGDSVIINSYNTGHQTIEGTTDPDATVHVFVDGIEKISVVADGSGNFNIPNTKMAMIGIDATDDYWTPKVVTLTASNANGESDPSRAISYQKDTELPGQLILVAPSDNSYLNSIYPAFEWDPNQNTSELDGYEMALYLNGSEYMQITIIDPSETNRNNIPLIDGNWQWKMRAIDLAGNFGPWSETWDFTIDTEIPNAPVLCSPENNTITDNPDVNLAWNCRPAFEIGDIRSTTMGVIIVVPTEYYELEIDGVSQDVYGRDFADTFSEGDHFWRVKAKDMAGNESEWSEMWKFTVDTTAPDAPTLISPANGFETEPADVTFSWTAVDDATEYELSVNGNTYTTINTTHTLNLPEGTYSWKVKAKDSFDRWGAYSSVWGLTLATADESQDDDQDNDDDADDQGTVAGVTDENTEENTINQRTTSSTTTTPTTAGTVAGTATFGTGGGADDEATEEEDENKDEEDGTVLGADDQDDPNLKAEASSFWDSFKWLLKKWWFWLILIIIILFLWWILGKRRKDDDKKRPLDIDNTPIR